MIFTIGAMVIIATEYFGYFSKDEAVGICIALLFAVWFDYRSSMKRIRDASRSV